MKNSPKVAVLGNPNCGKTAIFNLLTGLIQKVSNYHGITEGMKVEIYGIRIEKKYVTEKAFGGRTRTMETLRGRGYEEWVTDIFIETTGHIPILCVQKGNSTK